MISKSPLRTSETNVFQTLPCIAGSLAVSVRRRPWRSLQSREDDQKGSLKIRRRTQATAESRISRCLRDSKPVSRPPGPWRAARGDSAGQCRQRRSHAQSEIANESASQNLLVNKTLAAARWVMSLTICMLVLMPGMGHSSAALLSRGTAACRKRSLPPPRTPRATSSEGGLRRRWKSFSLNLQG